VPFGGALIYVPSDWVKPADGGVERLMNVYVSMGVTPPESTPTRVPRRLRRPSQSHLNHRSSSDCFAAASRRKAKVKDVALLHHIVLAFQPELAGVARASLA
jgi:hypothetical protein